MSKSEPKAASYGKCITIKREYADGVREEVVDAYSNPARTLVITPYMGVQFNLNYSITAKANGWAVMHTRRLSTAKAALSKLLKLGGWDRPASEIEADKPFGTRVMAIITLHRDTFR